MADATELTAAQLLTRCDPAALGFELSSELKGPPLAVGQERALAAMRFGIDWKQQGFNLFVVGPTGSGRSKLAKSFIAQAARAEPVPPDHCYVYNFEHPRRPRLLALPAGQGQRLRDHMEHLIDELAPAIASAFDNPGYRERREAIEQELQQRHTQEMNAIAERATADGVAVIQTPTGVVLAPMRAGKVVEPDEQDKLTDEERARFEQRAKTVHDELHEALRRVPQFQREQRDRVRRLDREITRALVRELLSEVRRAFGELPQVLEHLTAVEHDITEKTADSLRAGPQAESGLPFPIDGAAARDGLLRRYRVNLLVDHRASEGAPVVFEDNPSSGNLVGKVEHLAQLGVLVTDFNLIKPGALHRANGGYLIIDARRLLVQPVAYEQLKRTLRSGEIRIESVAEALDLSAGVSLEPDPIPFRGKLVLIGEAGLYHRLWALDPEFGELFKVAADFETDIERTPESCRAYAGLLARVAREEHLPVLSSAAAARLIERASRLAEDSTRLSMQVRAIFDAMREAAYFAGQAQRGRIDAEDVERALAASERRQSRVRERIHAAFADNTLRIETRGALAGQINGLAVVQLGESRFGFPTRITARVRLGKGEVVDIEREAELSGPIHSKGVLILSAFLGARYQVDKPFSLRATLVFEQSYAQVEGDSASLAELLALLSAIGELPLSQSIAVTGSVDQHGAVQAIGGVNDKIEGFFDVCRARGLTGQEGVIIPRANAKHLMLRADVVREVEHGRFHVFAVDHVDQAMQPIFGLASGTRGADGRFPEGSANQRVDARLDALRSAAEAASRAAQGPR